MSNFLQREEEILKFWKEKKIFEKSIEQRSADKPFIFYDGPPFATGLPHYGHILSSVIKDVIPRYKTMRGYRVPRRWGWDCHGLPIENLIEQELKISGKKEIENKIGIDKFNQACRDKVFVYVKEWKKMIDRIGRWVEFDNAYKTMDTDYIESVWWALKQIWNKGLIYNGYKVLMYCPRCETPISKAEVAMDHSYQDISEETIFVKFKIKGPAKYNLPENSYFLVWTTTPWTLPANVALAVGNNLDYTAVRKGDDVYVLAKERIVGALKSDDYKIFKEFKGSDLMNIEYEPLFEVAAIKNSGKKVYYVASADFVNIEEGTGLVHIAPTYGEDDYNLGLKIDLPVIQLLNEKGVFGELAPEFIGGRYFKDTDTLIKNNLVKRGLLLASERMIHSYPHCWRCETQLIYKAISAWFINIQKIKQRMIKLNEKINWYPEHLKQGRFLNILETAPDWNISRNRYWATPLPIWICPDCQRKKIIGSIAELKPYIINRNRFIFVRHGEAEHNIEQRLDSQPNGSKLTEKGHEQVKLTSGYLKKEGITRIISSPLHRAQETAEIISKICEVPFDTDERLWEIRTGIFDGKHVNEYIKLFKDYEEKLIKKPENGESLFEVGQRMLAAIRDYNSRYKGETIVVVSHGDPLWILESLLLNKSIKEVKETDDYIQNASYRELPVNIIDLHRPYIDKIELPCECGGKMKRVEEVVDCWVESASMPFAEHHYPFENKEVFQSRFPGDYIAEYIAQTRAWFYYMHALSVLLFDNISFRNCVTTGTILNEKGEKLSKSKRNFTDPWVIIERYGVDALRYYLMTSVVMQAENLFFKDDEVKDIYNKIINTLWNVFSFYQIYSDQDKDLVEANKSKNVLDKWILNEMNLLIKEVSVQMDNYNTVKAGRPIKEFIEGLSTWYLRRSRGRFKNDNEDDKQFALATLKTVLLNLSKIMAPFTPFIAESIYKQLTDEKESVNLEDWPLAGEMLDEKILTDMDLTRWVVSVVLEKRAKAGIPIRQVLQDLEIDGLKLSEEYLEIIKDEINVKEIKFGKNKEKNIKLNTEITLELRKEGMVREIIRHINAMRKEQGLTIKDGIDIYFETDSEMIKKVFDKYKEIILKNTLAGNFIMGQVGVDLKKTLDFDGKKVWVGIKKR